MDSNGSKKRDDDMDELDVKEEKPKEEPAPVARGKLIDVGTAVSNQDAVSIIDYFRNLSAGASVKLTISRTAPMSYRGKRVGGVLETVEDLLSEDEIKDRYGGGKYALRLMKPDVQGRWKFAGQRTVEIAGDPKLDGLNNGNNDDLRGPIIPIEDSSIQRHAMTVMERTAMQAAERADRAIEKLEEQREKDTKQSGIDPTLLGMIQSTLQGQVDAANRRMEALERERHDLLNRKPESNPVHDKLFEKILTDDNARVNSLREAHEKEIRAIRENHQSELRSTKDSSREDLKRVEDRADRLLDETRRAHTREVDQLRQGFAMQLESLKASNSAATSVLESENRRLGREVDELKTEVKVLREKKDKPFTETVIEIAHAQEAIKAAFGDKDDEPPSTFEKIMDRLGPLAEVAAARMAPQPQAQQAVPQRTLRRRVAPPQGHPQAQSGAPPTQVGTAPSEITPDMVVMAVKYIEQAVENNQEPATFVSAFQSMIDGNVIHAIKTSGGVLQFLENRVQLGVNSPLLTQRGTNFLRRSEQLLGIGHTPY